MKMRTREGISTECPVPAASKRFGRYKDENEKTIRGFDQTSSEGLKNILEAWMQIVNFPDMRQLFHDIGNPIYYTREAIAGKAYTSEDVTAFSIMMGSFQDESAFSAVGQFLSTLIKESKEERFRIGTRSVSIGIDMLGFYNTKQLTIDGDAGMRLGENMEFGSVHLKGNCGDYAGDLMRLGVILIEGDAGANAGGKLIGGNVIVKGSAGYGAAYQMHGGKVEIMGKAGDNAGHYMEGGELVIHGNAGDSVGRQIKGGTITVHGDVGDFLGGFETTDSWVSSIALCNLGMDRMIRTGRIMSRMAKGGEFDAFLKPPQKNTAEIIILGNAGEAVGKNMKGGTIRILGEFKSLGKNIDGRIYHKGALIAGKED